MSHASIEPCTICSKPCDARVSEYCSQSCFEGLNAIDGLGEALINAKPDPIKHIYFYDFAFGDLCDLFTTYLIRRTHTSNLQKQRVVDRALERVERAVTTKLNKWSPVTPIRKQIAAALQELYRANARIWAWNDAHMTSGKIAEGIPTDAWVEYVSAKRLRDEKRRELDRLVEGTTMTEKTYERQD